MSQENYKQDEINISELIAALWRERLIVGVITVLFVIGSVFYALSLANIYRSSVLASPAGMEQGGGLSSLASQFSGIASMAGVNLGGAGENKILVTLEVLKSRDFLMAFIQKYDLAVELMGVKGWNYKSKLYDFDNEIYDASSKTWVREAQFPKQPKPSLQELYDVFKSDYFSVSHDPKNNMVKMSFMHYSPYFAKKVLDNLMYEINLKMKKQDILEAEKSIKYLRETINETNIKGLQNVFFNLIEQQEQKKMLANIRDEYALKVIDSAIVSEERAKPKRSMIVLLGGILGVIFGCMIALIYVKIKEKRINVNNLKS